MADYLDILRGALSLGGFSPAPSQQMDRLLEIFRGRGGTPAPSAPGAPVTPAPTETAPPQIPGQPAQTARPRPPAPSPEMPLPPEPTSQVPTQAPRPTLLDQLRERVSQDTSSGGLRTAGDIGAGMLASRSPNFFTMLGEGLKAAQTGEQQRTRDLREAASTEAEQAYRQRMLELKEEEMRDPSVRALREAQAYYYRQRPEMAGAAGAARGQLTPAVLARLQNEARSRALTVLRNNPLATPAEIDALARRYFEEAVAAAGAQPPTPAAPTVQLEIPTITPAGRPTR